jgi:ribosomal protein L37AE/L43A
MSTHSLLGMEILAMRKACEEMIPYQRQDCPVCSWALETAADGITHCKFCGWADSHPIKRDVPRP